MKGFFLIFFFVFVSCDELVSKKGFDEKLLIPPELIGKYHRLEKENIEIFLPEGFYLLNEEDIKELNKRIIDDEIRSYYEQSYKIESFMKNKLYRFYGKDYSSEIVVKSAPYMPFNKSNARQLLYYLRKNFEKHQKITGIDHKKIKSTYSADKSKQIFKAIYSLSRIKIEAEIYKTVYIISSKNKTFMLTILTPSEIDFDPFISKIKL